MRDWIESAYLMSRQTGEQTSESLLGNTRAQGGMMSKGVEIAVGVMVVGLLAAFLLPVAIDEITAVDTSSWGDAETQLWDLLPIFFVLAILLFIIGWAMRARR